jgi:hypothetical protein
MFDQELDKKSKVDGEHGSKNGRRLAKLRAVRANNRRTLNALTTMRVTKNLKMPEIRDIKAMPSGAVDR